MNKCYGCGKNITSIRNTNVINVIMFCDKDCLDEWEYERLRQYDQTS